MISFIRYAENWEKLTPNRLDLWLLPRMTAPQDCVKGTKCLIKSEHFSKGMVVTVKESDYSPSSL